MRLVVTEKPSVARDLARVLGATERGDGFLRGRDLVVTWCVGHLLELEEPGHYDPRWKTWSLDVLPMIPERFALRVRQGVDDQWKVVRRWLRDGAVDEVVDACDAGREGELIFRQVYDHAGCKRPVLRFWVSSLTDEAIRAGWAALQPASRFDALGAAARCRSESDWLVGMNATRAMTCRTRADGGDALWSIGRVQTPTLAMIVARDRAIEAFVPETYGRVDAEVVAEPGGWRAAWFRALTRAEKAEKDEEPKDEAPKEERLASLADAERVAAAARGQAGRVSAATRRTRTEPPPLLYDLTELQRRANQRYGLSAQRTLEVAQALYERHKLLTYPRTDARHLTSDQVGELPGIFRAVGGLDVYRPFVDALLGRPLRTGKRLVDDAEVGDHHAIVPTGRVAEPGRLSDDEKRVYDLVARRLLAALSPDAVIDLAEIVVEVPPRPGAELPDVPTPLTFRAKGRVVREVGWQAVDPPPKRKDVELPAVDVGDAITVAAATAAEGQTRPPRPHDDASLLRGMETAGKDLDDAELRRAMKQSGLGTPATRAAILQTLLDRDYVVREGRALRATEKGKALVDAVPVEELKSAELTGRWEQRLTDVAEGRADRDAFMGDVRAYATRVVDAIRGAALPEAALVRTPREEGPSLGPCPVCGTPVRARGKAYGCESGRACPFVVFAEMAKRKIGVKMVKALLANGRTEPVEGFRSKAGKTFTAGLAWDAEAKKVTFWFPERQDAPPSPKASSAEAPAPAAKARAAKTPPAKAPAAGAPAAPPARPEDLACPGCGQGRVIRGHTAFGCSRWREGCGWRLPFEAEGRRLDDAEAVRRIRGGR